MKNFIFQNPTRLVFGKGQIAKLPELLPDNVNLMLTFGGGSVTKNGIYDQVKAALRGRNYVEFWGIEPNPQVETLRKAIKTGKENNINYLLAVGGGSVLDGTKLIAAGIASENDAWDIVMDIVAEKQIPFASVMTVPATGSEMNGAAVISRAETQEKYGFFGNYPTFAILDPEVTYSLSDHQIACGLADAFTHVLEQYLTLAGESRIMDRWAEGVLLSVKEIAPEIGSLPLIAHNSPFDEGCLKAVHKLYCMDYPDYQFYCTCRRSRRLFPELPNHQLHTVAAHCGYDLRNHHNALADAEAAAVIALNIFRDI